MMYSVSLFESHQKPSPNSPVGYSASQRKLCECARLSLLPEKVCGKGLPSPSSVGPFFHFHAAFGNKLAKIIS